MGQSRDMRCLQRLAFLPTTNSATAMRGGNHAVAVSVNMGDRKATHHLLRARKCAVQTCGGLCVSCVRGLAAIKLPEVVLDSVMANLTAPQHRICRSVHAFESALVAGSLGRVPHVFGVSTDSQVPTPVIQAVAIDVISDPSISWRQAQDRSVQRIEIQAITRFDIQPLLLPRDMPRARLEEFDIFFIKQDNVAFDSHFHFSRQLKEAPDQNGPGEAARQGGSERAQGGERARCCRAPGPGRFVAAGIGASIAPQGTYRASICHADSRGGANDV